VTMKRFPLFAALAFALPIAGLIATPAMAKPHKAKTHHVTKKVAAHKAPAKHKAKTSHSVAR